MAKLEREKWVLFQMGEVLSGAVAHVGAPEGLIPDLKATLWTVGRSCK